MALQQTIGSVTPHVHVILNQLRIPLADFAALGVDLRSCASCSCASARAGADDGLDPARRRPLPGGRHRARRRWATGWPRPPRRKHRDHAARPGGRCSGCPARRRGARPRRPPRRCARLPRSPGRACAAAASRSPARRPRAREPSRRSSSACSSLRESCRFARIDGTLGRTMPCSSRVGLAARGTTKWTLRLSRRWRRALPARPPGDRRGRGQRATAPVRSLRVR